MSRAQSALAQEAARIICEELITDYGLAKRKAHERLGGGRMEMPDNRWVRDAVVEYQRLFGGAAYAEQLRSMRLTAVRMLRWLAAFSPRLVGGSISGAVTRAHRVQLHLFADKAEMLDIFLHDHGVQYEQGERRYRYPRQREQQVPLASFEVDGIGVDAAVFPESEIHHPPIDPAEGHPFRRLALNEAEVLLGV